MKFRLDNKYVHWGITAFMVFAAAMIFYYAVFHMKTLIDGIRFFLTISAPIIYGFAIAYILSSVVNFFENKVVYPLLKKKNVVLEKRGKRMVRWTCVLFSMALFLTLIYTLIMMILPQLIRSITSIIYSFPSYVDSVEEWLNSIIEKGWKLDTKSIEMLNQYSEQFQNYLTNNILPRLQDMLVNISSGVFNILTVVKNFLIGAIISLYLLADKERFIAKSKMILYACISTEHANNIIHSMRFTHEIFGGFISGKLLDSAIIGVLCYIGISIMSMPYTILVSVIIGVTNVIPFFGPYLGAIPCILLILLVEPMKGLYFIIFILILQQFDGNILGPKILGDSTGLSSFMVIVAILIGGGFFGIGGMVIGVPVCAVIYASLNKMMLHSLHEKNLPTDEAQYVNIDCLDPETHTTVAFVRKPTFMEQHREERNNMFTKIYTFLVKTITFIVVHVYTFSVKTWKFTKEFSLKTAHKIKEFSLKKKEETIRFYKKICKEIRERKDKVKTNIEEARRKRQELKQQKMEGTSESSVEKAESEPADSPKPDNEISSEGENHSEAENKAEETKTEEKPE